MPTFRILPLTIDYYDGVLELLRAAEGVVLRDADDIQGVTRYVNRNPNTSFVAMKESAVVGCVFSGHDGRRGYLYHLAVAPEHRREGIGRALVHRCIGALADAGIEKVHLDVLAENSVAQSFWGSVGFVRRPEILRFSFAPSSRLGA